MSIVFTFSSTHKVITGEKALLDKGIKVDVIPLPSGIGAGCGLCLQIGRSEFEAAQALLLQSKSEPQSAYLKAYTAGSDSYTLLD